jgi:hypothetical protein
MKSAVLFLSIAALALAAPAIADARPDGRGGGGARAERRMDRPQARPDRPQARPDRPRGDRPRPDRPDRFDNPRNARPPVYRPQAGGSLGAEWRQQQDDVRRGVRQGRYVPLNRVIPSLQRRFPGRQLDAGLEQGWDGRPVYRVRWAATNGRRIDFIVDAQTGAVLDSEGQ